MAISDKQKTDKLFKSSLQSGDRYTGRDFFVEKPSPVAIIGEQVWIDEIAKPVSAVFSSNDYDGSVIEVVERIKGMVLKPIPGSQNAYAPETEEERERFRDLIPFTYDVSYSPVIKDASGANVEFGAGDWILDCSEGTLRFYDPTTLSFTVLDSAYFVIDCYKYVGRKGFSDLSGTGGTSGSTDIDVSSGDVNVLSPVDPYFVSVTATNTAVPDWPPTNVIDNDLTSPWLAGRSFKEGLRFAFQSPIILRRFWIYAESVRIKRLYIFGSNLPQDPNFSTLQFFNELVAGKEGYTLLTTYDAPVLAEGEQEDRFLVLFYKNETAFSNYLIMFEDTQLLGAPGIKINEVKAFQTEGNARKALFVDDFEEGVVYEYVPTLQQFEDHLSDYENPHRVTLAQLDGLSVAEHETWVENNFDVHLADKNNPHEVDKNDVGLGNVLNEQQLTVSQLGQPNGVADLDLLGKIPFERMPDGIIGGLNFRGAWYPDLNVPFLSNNGVGGEPGDYFVCATDGTTSLDGESSWATGDWVLRDSTKWVKVANSGSVFSVNGKSGIVSLDTDDIPEGLGNKYYTDDRVSASPVFVTARQDLDYLLSEFQEGLDGKRLYVSSDADPLPVEFGQVLPFDDRGSYVTGYRLSVHLTDYDRHFLINDEDINSLEVWSSQKITDYIEDWISFQHHLRFDNPHQVTKTDVGLANVENKKSVPADYLFPSLGSSAVPNKLNISRLEPVAGNISGIPWLDETGKIPSELLTFHGGLRFKGAWYADENDPFLSDADVLDHLEGDYFVCVMPGNTELGGFSDWQVGDWVMRLDDVWYRVRGSHLVVRVNGKVGIVNLNSNDMFEVRPANAEDTKETEWQHSNWDYSRWDLNHLYYTEARGANNWRVRRLSQWLDVQGHWLNNDDSLGLETTVTIDFPDVEPEGNDWPEDCIDPVITVEHSTVNDKYTPVLEIREHFQDCDNPVYGDGREVVVDPWRQGSNPHDTRFGNLRDVPEYRLLRPPEAIEIEHPYGVPYSFYYYKHWDGYSGETVINYENFNSKIQSFSGSSAYPSQPGPVTGSRVYYDVGAALFGVWHNQLSGFYGSRPEALKAQYGFSTYWQSYYYPSGSYPILPVQDEWIWVSFNDKTEEEILRGIKPAEWHEDGYEPYVTWVDGVAVYGEETYFVRNRDNTGTSLRTDGFVHRYVNRPALRIYDNFKLGENGEQVIPDYGTYPNDANYEQGLPPFVYGDDKTDYLSPSPIEPQPAYIGYSFKGRIFEKVGEVVNCLAIYSVGGCGKFSIFGSFDDEQWHRLYTGENETAVSSTVIGKYNLSYNVYLYNNDHNRWMEEFGQFHHFDNNIPFRFYKVIVHNANNFGAIHINKIFFLNHNAGKMVAPSSNGSGIELVDRPSTTILTDHIFDYENPHKLTAYQVGAPGRKEFFDLWSRFDITRSNYYRTKADFEWHIELGSVIVDKHNKWEVQLGNVDNVKQIPWSSRGVPNGVPVLDDYGSSLEGRIPYRFLPDALDPRKGILDVVTSYRVDVALSANRGRFLYNELLSSDNRNSISFSDKDQILNHAKANYPSVGRIYFDRSDGSVLVCDKEIPGYYSGYVTDFSSWTNSLSSVITLSNDIYPGKPYCQLASENVARLVSDTAYNDYSMKALFGATDYYDSGFSGYDYFGIIASFVSSDDHISVIRSSNFYFDLEFNATIDCALETPMPEEYENAVPVKSIYDGDFSPVFQLPKVDGDKVLVTVDGLAPGEPPMPGDPDYEEGNTTPYYWWYNSDPDLFFGRIDKDMNGNQAFAEVGSIVCYVAVDDEWKVYVPGPVVVDEIENNYFSILHQAVGDTRPEVYLLNSYFSLNLFTTVDGYYNIDDIKIGDIYRLTNVSSALSYWLKIDKRTDGTGEVLSEDCLIRYDRYEVGGNFVDEWRIEATEQDLYNGDVDFSYIIRDIRDNVFFKYERDLRTFVEFAVPNDELVQRLSFYKNFGRSDQTLLTFFNLDSRFVASSRSFHRLEVERKNNLLRARISTPNSSLEYSDWLEYSIAPIYSGRSVGVIYLNSPETVLEEMFVQKEDLLWDESWVIDGYFVYANLKTELLLLENYDLGDIGSTVKTLSEKPLNELFNRAFDDIDDVAVDLEMHLLDMSNPHQVTKNQVGLGNVLNETQIPVTWIGQENGVCPLDDNGAIPSSIIEASGFVTLDEEKVFIDPDFLPYDQAFGLAKLDSLKKISSSYLDLEALASSLGLGGFALKTEVAILDSFGIIQKSNLPADLVYLVDDYIPKNVLPSDLFYTVDGFIPKSVLPGDIFYLDDSGKVDNSLLYISSAPGVSGGEAGKLITLNDSGYIDNGYLEALISQTSSFYLEWLDEEVPGVRETVSRDISGKFLDPSLVMSNVNGGFLKLDENGKVPLEHLPVHDESYGVAGTHSNGIILQRHIPPEMLGALVFRGSWNATTNVPELGDGGVGGPKGWYFVVDTAGTTSLDGMSVWNVGDWVINSGDYWYKLDNNRGVLSINELEGHVVLNTASIPEGSNKYYTEERVSANTDVAAAKAKMHDVNKDTALSSGSANEVTAVDLRAHLDDITGNPHELDPEMIGAASQLDFQAHLDDEGNPHVVGFSQLSDNDAVYNDFINLFALSRVINSQASSSTAGEFFGTDKAFDGNPDTMWLSNSSAAQWLEVDFGFGNRQKPYKMRFYFAGVQNDLVIKASNTLSGENLFPLSDAWDVLYSHSGVIPNCDGITDPIELDLRTITLSPTNSYRFFRFEITSNTGGNNVNIRDVVCDGDRQYNSFRHDSLGRVVYNERIPFYEELKNSLTLDGGLGGGGSDFNAVEGPGIEFSTVTVEEQEVTQISANLTDYVVKDDIKQGQITRSKLFGLQEGEIYIYLSGALRRGKFARNIVPIGSINGVNKIFQLEFIPFNLQVRVNGLWYAEGLDNDYTVDGLAITFNDGAIPQTSSVVYCDFIYFDSAVGIDDDPYVPEP